MDLGVSSEDVKTLLKCTVNKCKLWIFKIVIYFLLEGQKTPKTMKMLMLAPGV